MFTRLSRGFKLAKFGGKLQGYDSLGMSARNSTMEPTSQPFTAFGFALLAVLAVIAVIVALVVHPEVHLVASSHMSQWSLLGVAGITATRKSGTDPKKPVKIREQESAIKALARELEAGTVAMADGPISPEYGEELEQKAQEMEELQSSVDRYNKIAKIVERGKQVDRVVLPGESETGRPRSLKTTPGHLFILSDAFQKFKHDGIQSGFSGKVTVGKRLGKTVTLRGEEAISFERKAFDAANLPNLGDDAIIAIDRDPEIVRFQEPEILSIRDVLNVVPTTSDAIRYVKLTQVTRAAAPQASRGAPKPYLTVEYEPVDTTVKTIAVLSKVTEQDIADSPRLVGFINGEMQLDVRTQEEYQLTWGNGTSGGLYGLFDPTVGIPEFDRAASGDTVIDTIRKMRTDLRKARVTPNFVAIDPIDWETVELAKGTTEQYIWGLITDLRGPRIWSLRVVESDAMTNVETGERRILMGDGTRGATIYDREGIQLAVGLVDDDFARNLRTLRAEERIALAVKRAFAFEYFTTAEASS